MAIRSVTEITLPNRPRGFHPSPAAWEDEVIYFLMLDRFSDGSEDGYRGNDGRLVRGTTPRLGPGDAGNAIRTDADATTWREAGGGWVGGTLEGLTSKLGYLGRLGITALWVSPLLRQVRFQDTYHGYGVQNFLEVEPHFGSLEDLKTMVRTAHENGIHVIVDIILNHTADVFAYDPDRYPVTDDDGNVFMDARWDGNRYRVKGFRDEAGNPRLPFQPVDLQTQPPPSTTEGIWPAELYDPATFTQKGRITNWDYFPEFLEGDFEIFKNITHGEGSPDDYRPSSALLALTRIFQYWIAEADLDGFRVDTVKHMDAGATRFFGSAIHEFAQSIGKENFYLLAEITGSRENAYRTLEETGVDAALGIAEIPDKLEGLVKGTRPPSEYFDLFRNSLLVRKDSHVWFRNKVVTFYDNHDQINKGNHKARFCADDAGKKLALAALAINALTLGIPCIYYGSEQGLDGAGNNDRYIREALFGGAFGAFRSRERHVFNEDTAVYRELAKILALRRDHLGLRRGRQYLREISGDGIHFGFPQPLGSRMLSIVPWSRIFADRETLVAINTDPDAPLTAWVTIDNDLHGDGAKLGYLYSSDPTQIGQSLLVEARNGKSVELTVPAAGVVVVE